jgi:hypothetical protein
MLKNNIELAMKMSELVYQDVDNLPNTCTGFSGPYEGQALVSCMIDTPTLIAFRGTNSYEDWSINLMRRKTNYFCRGAYVHSGFLKQYNNIKLSIFSKIKTLMPIEHIIITGHSLGGALSVLCACDLAEEYPNLKVECLTFGSPKVGNWKFVDEIENISNLFLLRINHEGDFIPQLPCCGFSHTKNLLSIRCSGMRWYEFRKRHELAHMMTSYMNQM